VDGGGLISEESFALQPGRWQHCSLQFADDSFILTGGAFTESKVTEYSDLDREEVTSRELPQLLTGRRGHACGGFTFQDRNMMIVTGGYDGSQDVASTEVMDFSDGEMVWRKVGELPSARSGFGGANVDELFHVAGGMDENYDYLKEILLWDPVAENWQAAGEMKAGRWSLAVSEVPLSAVLKFCL